MLVQHANLVIKKVFCEKKVLELLPIDKLWANISCFLKLF